MNQNLTEAAGDFSPGNLGEKCTSSINPEKPEYQFKPINTLQHLDPQQHKSFSLVLPWYQQGQYNYFHNTTITCKFVPLKWFNTINLQRANFSLFRRLVRRVPWEAMLKGKGVQKTGNSSRNLKGTGTCCPLVPKK